MKRNSASRGGSGRGRAKHQSNSGSLQGQSFEGLYANERLVNLATSVLGCSAKVTVKCGKQFEGVFQTISPQGSVVLGKANQVDEQPQNGIVKTPVSENLVVNRKTWVKMEFTDVDLDECIFKKDFFKTDNAIASRKTMNGQSKREQRELEKWNTAVDGDGSLETAALEGSHVMENGWSAEQMFNVNEKKYGVKSTYNEDMEEYTTKLEKSDTPEYREKEKFAAQKAEEIFKESPYERNLFDSSRSEEQLYSSVVRNSERSSTPNWRQPQKPSREQRAPQVSREDSGSPAPVKKEPARSPQVEESQTLQVEEKIEKPATESPVECKPESKPEAVGEVIKTDASSLSDASVPKPPVTSTSTAVTQTVDSTSSETPDDPTNVSESIPTAGKTKNTDPVLNELKSFSTNFKLQEKGKDSGKQKKVKKPQEEEKPKDEKSEKEVDQEAQTTPEVKSECDSTSSEKKVKHQLNPNAQEFRPSTKRTTPSPRSSNANSSSGAPSPFQNSLYMGASFPPNNVYSRSGPRGRGMRPEYIEHGPFVNASKAIGQPFFANHLPPQFMPQPPPYIQPGGLRHPGMQPPIFIQHNPQGPVVVPLGQMPPGPYPDGGIYYGPPHGMPMIQSPPQITSPSLQQSQFNFPSPAMQQSVNAVRSVSQPPVLSQQPPPHVVFIRPTPSNEMQPTQILNRPAQAQSFQGN